MPSRESATTAAPLAAIQRSVGIDFIHSISAKPASRAGAKAIPQPSSLLSASRHGLHHRARLGREQGDHADDGQDHQRQRQQLADGAPADAETVRAFRRRRVAVRRRVLRRVATAAQTSITIGRIIGRRLVRSKKNRASVSRILALRKPDSAA